MTTSIGKVLFADGAYEGNDIFGFLSDNGIMPCIKVKRECSSSIEKRIYILRNLSVISQKKDLQRWKDSIVSYAKRWIVEMVFSSALLHN